MFFPEACQRKMKSMALGGLGLLGREVRQSPLILGSVGEDGQPAPESGPLCVLLAPVV